MNKKLQIKRLLASGVKLSNKIFTSLRKTQAQTRMIGLRASRLARYNARVIAKDFKTLKLIVKAIDRLALANIKTPRDVINASSNLENILKHNSELKTRISVLAKLIKASELPIDADDEFDEVAPVDEVEADDEFDDVAPVDDVEADDEFEELQSRAGRMKRARRMSARRSVRASARNDYGIKWNFGLSGR